MSEAKKVILTTVSYDKGKAKSKQECKTIRFHLPLTESNEKSCSEFNYGELLTEHFHKKFVKDCPLSGALNGPDLHANDPFNGQDSDALKNLAKKFDKRYGTSIRKKTKKKKNSNFDVLGQGYDESDPFIDNSDALDDVVPKNVDTKYGGFYINSGELDFHEVQVSDDDSQVAKVDGRRRKSKIIESSDEDKESSKKKQLNGYVNDKFDEGEIHQRRKKLINKFNAKKQKLQHSEDENGKEKPPANKSMETSIAASIEAVIKKVSGSGTVEIGADNDQDEAMEVDDDEPMAEAGTASGSSSASSSAESSSSESESENDQNGDDSIKKVDAQVNSLPLSSETNRCSSPEGEEIAHLPSNIPQAVISILDKIKEVGRNSRGSSQKFFSDPAVNKMLLSIEIKLNKLGGGRTKTQTYKHLACHLPCGMQTIVKRGKNLLAERLEGRLRIPMDNLKEIINRKMPALLAAYDHECQKYNDQKNEKLVDSVDNNTEKKSGNNMPKKKFIFFEEVSSKLCEVVKVKCQGWYMVKKRNEDPEEHVKGFIEDQIKPLWPKGWVSTKQLYKISSTAHSFITAKKVEVSLPVENKAESGKEFEKSELSYEQIQLPYHLEKIVKKETAKISSQQVVSTENIVPTVLAETPSTQQVKVEKKVTLVKSPTASDKSRPDLAQIAINEHITKAFSDNVGKSVKAEESRPKTDQPLNFSLESSKAANDLSPTSINYRPKITSTHSDQPPIEGRPPKPSLSATAVPKINHVLKDSTDPKDLDRSAFTFINIKSVDKIAANSHKNVKGEAIKKATEVTRTVESVSIVDLSIGESSKAESTIKLPTSSPIAEANKSADSSTDQVVDLCMKSSPVKNAKLDQEMDKVMNDLLEISRNIQGTPEPSPQPAEITPPSSKNISPTIPRYRENIKGEIVSTVPVRKCDIMSTVPVRKNDIASTVPIRKDNSNPNHSVITTTSKPAKTHSTEFMDAFKSSLAKSEMSASHRQPSEGPYKPKTVFQESYLAQNLPSKMIPKPQSLTGPISVSLSSKNSASIINASVPASKGGASIYSVTSSNNVSSSVTHASTIQRTSLSKNIISPNKNMAEIIPHRPVVSMAQRSGSNVSMQSAESSNRLPSTVSMHHLTSSPRTESLNRSKSINSSAGHHGSGNISIKFNPTHGSNVKSKPHTTNHFPSNHSIQSLSQSSTSHRYDPAIPPNVHNNQGQSNHYHSNRNSNERQSQKASADPLANLRLMQGLSVSSVPKKAAAHSTTSSHSASLATSSLHNNSGPLPDTKGKHGNDNLRKVPSQSPYSNLSPEQMDVLRKSSQHQQEFWKHINSRGYFTSLNPSDAMRYMNQGGQYTGNGSGSSKQGQY